MIIFTWKHTVYVCLVMMRFEINGMRASTFGELTKLCACASCQANKRALNWSLFAGTYKRKLRQTEKTEITLNNFESYLRYHIFQPFLTVTATEWVRWKIVIFCDFVARGPNPCALKYSFFFLSYFPFNEETKHSAKKITLLLLTLNFFRDARDFFILFFFVVFVDSGTF